MAKQAELIKLTKYSNYIGLGTFALALAEMAFFSLWFYHRERIYYLAIGLQGYAALIPAFVYMIQYQEDYKILQKCYAYLFGIVMTLGQLVGYTTILVGILTGGDP